jgi:hypothetical protein
MKQLNSDEQNLLKYVAATMEYFAALRVIPRNFRICPFDTVGLELLSKSVSITRSCLILIEANQAEEAFGLGRSLSEVALILRHITRDKSQIFSESHKFLQFSFADKNFWLFQARRTFTSPEVVADINYHASKWDYTGNKPMTATRSWSDKYNAWKSRIEDHPIDGMVDAPPDRIIKHAIEYTQASFFVHCTQPSLDNFFPQEGEPFKVKESSCEYVDSRGTLFYLLLTNLHEVVLYILFGLNLDLPTTLINLFNEILDNATSSEYERYLTERKIKQWQR